ncbi:unnamed protein product [Linum trigynum]|uniref:Protein arginine methyltransferase NDUFAF7 n=1 Tax=Linum trigynum TaxID=586398 RepID=A0AAV2ETI5_9ROSI
MAVAAFRTNKLSSLFRSHEVISQVLINCSFRHVFSTSIVRHEPILVRDFVHSALYDPNHGYFSQRSRSVGVMEKSIKFDQLEGREAYVKKLDKVYKQSDVSWFTPVELFKPWYAYGIAEAIMRSANFSLPLKIYEIGGGSGTCAKGILDYIMLHAPERVYNNMTYTSIEISSSLAEIQKKTVGEIHKPKFRVEGRDAADRSGWGEVEQQPCWVIMLEVLDNLPHDLIYSESRAVPWKEVWVEKQQNGETLSELYKPLQDPLINRCIEIMESKDDKSISNLRNLWFKLFPKPRRCWLPTGSLKLLEVLHEALPMMSLIASDYSYLPDVTIPGVRAPLVSTKKDGQSSDYKSYLDAKGDADIFFPTDFWLLERMDHYCSKLKVGRNKSSKEVKKRRTLVLDTAAFMEEFALHTKTRTKDGYNPLLEDFSNTKFYISVPTHNIQ